MHAFYQTLQEEYYTTAGWQRRECYPWEYDTKIQELLAKKPSYFTTEDDCKWFQQQAKILQNRADHIRQAWARKEADELFKQQLATLQASIQASIQANLQWQATQATQQSTPPAPQEAQEEKANLEENAEITAEKQEQEPLYQATVEDDEHGNSMTASKSMLPTKLRLCTAPASRDPAACLSNALFASQYTLLFACQHTMFLASLFGSFFGSFFASQFGCIRCMEGMEASGQG